MGNVGIVTVIVTATSSFTSAKGLEVGFSALVLAAGLGLILIIARHSPLARRWEAFAQKRLEGLKIFEDDSTVDELLHLTEGYGVARICLSENSPLIGQTLSEINSAHEYSFILGIERGKEWLPTLRSTRKPRAGDYLVVYGRLDVFAEHFA